MRSRLIVLAVALALIAAGRGSGDSNETADRASDSTVGRIDALAAAVAEMAAVTRAQVSAALGSEVDAFTGTIEHAKETGAALDAAATAHGVKSCRS